jgi:CCR4-NOT transcription complex subunit 4
MWCWHHIKDNLNNLCPACRTPYQADPHAFSARPPRPRARRARADTRNPETRLDPRAP